MGERGIAVRLKFLCLNLEVETFSSALLRVVKIKRVREGGALNMESVVRL